MHFIPLLQVSGSPFTTRLYQYQEGHRWSHSMHLRYISVVDFLPLTLAHTLHFLRDDKFFHSACICTSVYVSHCISFVASACIAARGIPSIPLAARFITLYLIFGDIFTAPLRCVPRSLMRLTLSHAFCIFSHTFTACSNTIFAAVLNRTISASLHVI